MGMRQIKIESVKQKSATLPVAVEFAFYVKQGEFCNEGHPEK
jgi:hypothetical protein